MFVQGPRSAAVSVFVVINWLCNFAVGLVFPILQKSFLPFSVMLLLFFIFTYMFVPETKGKSISEIPSCLNLSLWIDQNPEIPTKAQRTDTAPKS
ncbi:solute carrier family 2, facilitated glucose transporter member 2-like [Biomphalaria glabrata]|uniref:Solute carrier family 2, facilitated glucose transporter member 2-like n=1 Tax=Biomphalaria glabrata TaxID=6526 RepID=A0A9W2ZII8_BIOGL|nr:solute carrier family 2, facilitated glucose transporter member 2-like [Biomphalaria glabrata]